MKLFSYVSKEEILKILMDLLAIESHRENEQKEEKVAQYIHQKLKEEGIATKLDYVEPKRPNVYGFLGEEGDVAELMFNGHIDTIPGFQMDYEPFQPFVKDGIIYGRGTADMKGGIAAYIAALLAAKRSGFQAKKTVMFAGVTGEEERSNGTEHLIKTGKRAKYVVIAEPTSLQPCIAHKGMEWIEVKFIGRATHGSRPHDGINAVYAGAQFCSKVERVLQNEIERRTFPMLGTGTINVGSIAGGTDPNIVPDECIISMDRRWLPSETLEMIHGEIEEIAKEVAQAYQCKYQFRAMRELTAAMINAPYALAKEDEWAHCVCDASEEVLNCRKEVGAFPAWSDAGILGVHTDAKCVILGPGNITQAHANDEFCELKEVYQAAEIYLNLIGKICG